MRKDQESVPESGNWTDIGLAKMFVRVSHKLYGKTWMNFFANSIYLKKKKNDNQMQCAILDWTRKGIFFPTIKTIYWDSWWNLNEALEIS